MPRGHYAPLAGAIVFGFTSMAFATDLPIKAPVAAPPPFVVYNWTGFYVGAALGGKWSSTTWTTTSLFSPPFANPPLDASSPKNFVPSSGRFGVFFGYNWQLSSRWVGGVEFDWAYANKTVTVAGVPGCAILCIAGFPGPVADLSSVSMRWDASARVRLGYLVLPNMLAYGTGGIAWQNIQVSATCQHSVVDPLCVVVAGNPLSTATNSVTRTGWTVGAGLDARISGNWIVRGEYRYAYFGKWNEVLDLSVPGAPTTVGYQLKVSTQIATLGLAYQFGGPAAAISTKSLTRNFTWQM